MENEIINAIKSNPVLLLQYMDLPIPAPYFTNSVKAIVLGADPSNFSDNGETRILNVVFDLPAYAEAPARSAGGSAGKPNGDMRYFSSILSNLNCIGLQLEDVYVQNVVRNYCTAETAKNKHWFEFAELWKPLLKEDLDKLDPERKLPVFATTIYVFKSLINDKSKILDPARLYYEQLKYHLPEENYLERKLIPCFRHMDYPYTKWEDFKNFVKTII